MAKRIAIIVALIVVTTALGLGLFWSVLDKPEEYMPAPQSTVPIKPQQEYHIEVLSVDGKVDRRGEAIGWVPLQKGERLKTQESIRTDETGRAVLDVGETATVTVEPMSQFSVREISRAAARVRIDIGRIGAVVHGKNGSKLHVESKGSDAVAETDLGEFFVQSTGTGRVSVATRKGRVRFSAKGKTVEVITGHQSIVWPELAPSEPEPIPTTLFLKLAPPKKRIQRQKQTTIKGWATPGAVISIDGVRAESDREGEFQTRVALKEGKNRITVVAEDVVGNHQVAKVPVITVKSQLSKVHSKAGQWGTRAGKK